MTSPDPARNPDAAQNPAPAAPAAPAGEEHHDFPRPTTPETSELLSQTSVGPEGEGMAREPFPGMPELCRAAATEGLVLLTNDGTLPLTGSVAVFGRVQVNYFGVGYGSGGDVHAPYTTNLLDSLREAAPATGIEVDAELAGIYESWCAENVPDEGDWGNWPRFFEEMPLADDAITAAAARSRTAVVVIGRAAGEDRESSLTEGSFVLTGDERHLLGRVTAAFERTVVVLDCGNVIDLGWLADYGDAISAVLYAWQGGMEAGHALADVLTGRAYPSGKLTDTIAHRYEDYPSADHFGEPDANDYVEDVYVGYRYFETFAQDAVLFPFGFGLGYTSFDIAARSPLQDPATGDVSVEATVTNTGSRPGKEVVQLYAAPPQGALGKPARNLVAFAKTDEIAPGASQQVTLTVPVALLASYDDAGASGHKSAWVLEAGEYGLFLGADSRSASPAGALSIPETRVVEQLAEAAAVDPATPFDRLVARLGDGGAIEQAHEPAPTRTVDLAERILGALPEASAGPNENVVDLSDVAAGTATLDEFVAQLTPIELEALSRGDDTMNSPLGAPGNAGALGGVRESLRKKGVPAVITTDGPSGIRLAAYTSLLPCGTALASTWNTPLVQELAALHGREMVERGSDILLSPGMNIHRNPLCGRNFEYYSEDPLVAGRTAGAVVRGVQSAGVAACPKHFACNSQETNRNFTDSRVSERALREIYLRGFELVVKEAAPLTIMTSYNKVNGVWSHYHYELVTTILREQWGFAGMVMTDWWMQPSPDPHFPDLSNNAYRVRAGVDVLMPGSSAHDSEHGDGSLLESYAEPDGITLGEMQDVARHVLRLVLASHPFAVGTAGAAEK